MTQLNRDTLVNMIATAREKFLENAEMFDKMEATPNGFFTAEALPRLAEQFRHQADECSKYIDELIEAEEEIVIP